MVSQLINNRKVEIYSCYYNNLSQDIIKYQREVFNKFNIQITQEKTDNHPRWMDSKIKSLDDFDIIIFFDIDCIPLKPGLLEYIVEQIGDNNSIIGIEQAANHIDSNFVYAGPACLAFTKIAYEKMKKPTFLTTYRADTAGELTFAALENNVNVKYFNITSYNTPLWKCGNKYFGEGTIYDDWLYHQFNSSAPLSVIQFVSMAQKIINKFD